MPANVSSAHETRPAIHRLQYDSCQMDGLTAREAAGVAAVCSTGVYLLRNRVALRRLLDELKPKEVARRLAIRQRSSSMPSSTARPHLLLLYMLDIFKHGSPHLTRQNSDASLRLKSFHHYSHERPFRKLGIKKLRLTFWRPPARSEAQSARGSWQEEAEPRPARGFLVLLLTDTAGLQPAGSGAAADSEASWSRRG
jgi:hypothetical protein